MLNYKFRLYPTKEQELVLEQTLDGCRWVYNYFLSIPPMSEYDMNYALTELKEQHSWLRNYHSKMLQMVGKQVAAARKTARGKKLSYRKNDDFNAFTYNQTGFRIESKKLMLSKIGAIKIVLHRQPLHVKQVTVCRKNMRWYAVVSCEILRRHFSTIIVYNKPVGIDAGISRFAHDSDNRTTENPQFFTKMVNYPRLKAWASCFIDANLLIRLTSRGCFSARVCSRPRFRMFRAALWSLSKTSPQL